MNIVKDSRYGNRGNRPAIASNFSPNFADGTCATSRPRSGDNMRQVHLRIRQSSVLVTGFVLAAAAFASPQSAQKKPSVWDRIKQAAQQGQQQPGQQPQQPQQQPGQRPQRPGQQPSAGGSSVNDSGPFKPPAGTKIEEKILAPVQDRAKFEVSPHGVHVATLETEGSRAVVWYDGVEGPKFDEILPQNGNYSIAFSPDGNRYAYCARLGNQMVVMLDSKEFTRSSESIDGHYEANNCDLGFTANSKHLYYRSWVNLGTERGKSFERFVFDGKPSPPGSVDKDSIAISPDGEHFAYTLTISPPRDQDRYEFAVDGKVMPYVAGGAQWTRDSKHLYTQRRGGAGVTELLYDGQPIARAFSFRVYIAPVGDMVVVNVTGGTNFHPLSFLVVNGKKVPGSDTVERGMVHDVVFSPDGRHYAAHYEDLSNHHTIFMDGKRAQEYSFIDKITFTPDSSTLVYMAQANGKVFIVAGDKEFGGSIGSVLVPVFSPVGNRFGAFIGNNGTMSLLMDGKIASPNARALSDLSFTPDGQHYGYCLTDSGMGTHLAIDGAVLQQSNYTKVDIMDLENPQALQYMFSPDSKHMAHFAQNDASNLRGVFLDGVFIPASLDGVNTKLVFSPDSKHLFWIHRYGNQPNRVFVDGKPLVDYYAAGNMVNVPHWWEFGPDGTLSFLAQDDNSLKRITITLSDATSLATMLGSGPAVASRGN